jgi:hypothetical protein
MKGIAHLRGTAAFSVLNGGGIFHLSFFILLLEPETPRAGLIK